MCSSPVMATGNWCSMTGPRSILKDATKMYSTWFSGDSRGYWDRNFRGDLDMGGLLAKMESDESSEATVWLARDDVFELELGWDVRSGSVVFGLGECRGLEGGDMPEAELDREEGKDERDVR
ncbi:hypothetical protein RRF57_007680 [Xylaria bambusicola]|uniref:Uncharacterized protein n=1 Tax=Xylaria bambusicola TaxID=326684 RepID=A0AAN7USE8_9PEZI